ncbi:MAG: hypothetical protein KH304_21525 [Clostridium sp.]|uniref:hypothetical protein n=1 Tax=Faecalicatena contorta TaxID=39482 RepID=UPI00142FE5D9|nr:hypothetical protein [Clostridium sp.]
MDWCQITIKGRIPLEQVITKILKIPLELMLGNIPDKGFAGHQIVAGFGNIKLTLLFLYPARIPPMMDK